MKQRLRRPLALLLTVVMVLGLLPTAAFAVEGEELGETVTASIPGAITLENVEREVGDEVTLDGTTTVSDGGTLSYQWYQSGDLVDDANAADEEKNDTLLEDQTGATLTVDTSVAGTFYYYVVATNTVTLEDGGTDTASTTSNVAMVTVKEAEHVTPSENSEPEDGQEPPTDSTPADDQTPGNDNANEEPESNDLNDGEPLPPTDNSGLEQSEPDSGDSVPQADSTAEITALTLINFTPHGGTGSSNEDLLEKTDPDKAVQWDLFNSYALQVSVTVPAGNEDNTFTLTLPHGMKFVNLNTSNLEQTDGIAEAQYKKDEQIANFIPVDGESGTLTVVFESNAQQVTFSVLVQPDVAFFPLENKSEGWLISDAIQATLTCGESVAIKKIIPVEVRINSDVDLTARSLELRIGDIYAPKPNVAPGEEYRLDGNVWTGWIDYNGRQNYRLRSEVVVVLSVPEDLSLKRIGGTFWQVEQEQEGEDSDNYDYNLWKLTATNIWNVTPSFVNQIAVVIPKDAEPGTSYAIKQSSISVTTYGQEKAWTVGAPENGQPIWTLTVQNPNEVKVSFQTGNITNVYDFTNQSTENGEPFTNYNTSFAGVKLTNDGVGDITGGLIYKAEFGQNVQFVTAVGIPCGWDDTENTWLPTKITVHTDADKTYIISAKGSDYTAIRDVASLAYAGKGFILRASDIDGLAPTESITSVEVELPGLPKGYASSNYFLTENGGANNAYTGVWGRVRENRRENATDENVFSLWQGSEAEEALVRKTATTNIAESGKLSVATPYSQIKIKDKSGTAASANDIVHIRQSIEPNRAHGSFHDAETLLYDPVIYLFEPKDLSIENVTFSIETANGEKIENLSYTADPISGSIEGLPNTYNEVYQYTLSDKVMLGWWSGDWDAVTLYVDFDYRVAPAAKTNAYDLRDMIFYKSSLNFSMTNNGLPDLYTLNDGDRIGGVASKIFTVQAATTFNVATAIQIEGENKWYSYNPEDKANTTSVFTEGATANVKVTVTNNSGDTADDAEVYIPIPKKDQASILGEHFIQQAGFDMSLAGYADLTSAAGWTVKYGQVTKVTLGENDVPTGDFTLQDGEWSDSYDDDTNMIKLTLSSGMADGTSAEIILKFKATDDASQTDSMNIFKSWYKYSTTNAAMVDTEKVYNFGTLLQNGKLDGTVYLDANRNGVKNEGETGIEGVTVKVVDEDGRTYETQTGEGGAYSFNSLPGNKTLTLTVTNPSSPDPNNIGGSYRFYGGDVTPAEDNRSASKSGFTLEGGTATVNAGLIKPYTVTFLVAGGDGTTSFVNPSTRKIYAGQTLGEVTERVTVSLAPGLNFENKWNKMPTAGGESIEVQHSDLLKQTVTADTTFTAVTTSTKNTVTAMWWNTQTSSITQQFEQIVDWSRPVGDSFPTDGTVNNRPGYNFTGWSVNGTSTIVQRGQIINASVTGAVNYIAQYTEKTDITVTLNANGGAFADGKVIAEMTGQKYGAGVDYETPTREGYTFLGWSTDQNAETGSMSLTCPATDTTFYAVWEPGTVRLTLLENGGTWTDGSDFENGYIDGTVGEAVNLPGKSNITREGYEFLGWYVQGDVDQTIQTDDYKFPTKATTLIAKWQPKQESITFDYGAGSGIASETVSGAHGTPVGDEQAQKLTNVEREGWSLIGWKNEDTGVVTPAANTGSIVIEAGQKYIAQWAQGQSILKFDAGDGAKFPNNGQIKTYYGDTGSTLEHGEPVNPEREGYKFLGWFESATGGDAVTEFTFPQTANAEETYYAQWEKETYTVTFRYNGGTLEGADHKEVPVEYRDKVDDVPTPTNGNAELLSWTDVSTGETYSAEQIENREVKANTIYSANWNLPSYQVTFGNLGGNPDSTSTVSVTSGNGVFAPDPQTPEGKVFLYWKLTSDPDATKTEYSDQDLAKLTISENMTFQAMFGEDSYTITFITSNGSFEDGDTETTITKQGGQTLAENDFPTVTGNTANFTGWYYNGTTQTVSEWAGTEVSGNMTFVAAFEGKVTVSFDTMGGKWTESGKRYANGIEGNAGESMTLPTAEHITRTGYTFTGWYTDMACTTKAPDVFPGSRTTYYAGWNTEGLSVTVNDTPTYDGTAKTPDLTVMSGTTELTSGQYVPSWSNNTNAGTDTASVTVYGLDEYADLTGTATFTINKAAQTVTFAKDGEQQTATYGETFANTATAKLDSANATITYSSSNESIATVDENGTVTILKSGEVTITATAKETDNVNKGEATYTLTIGKAKPTLTFANSTVSVKTTGSVSNKLTTEPEGLTVTYTSSDPKVATVDGNGNVTLVGEGTATITATFEGNDCYKQAEDSYILTVDNDAIVYTAEGWYGTYDGTSHGITVDVTTPNTGAKVTYSTTEDGTYSDQNPTYTNARTYVVYFKIEAKGYDAVTGSAKVIIGRAQLTDATVTGGPYTGQAVGSVTEVKAGELTGLEKDKDYTVTFNNNVNAGENTAMAVIMGTDNFTGTLIKNFTIDPKQLTSQMVTAIADQPYTGEQVKPDVTVTDGAPLVEGKDFTVSYGDNNTVGTNAGTVTIKGTGNYAGEVKVNFNITNTGAFKVIVDNSEHTYNGSAHTPSVVVYAVDKDGVMTPLKENTDYTVSYADNTNAGAASVTITGKGAYAVSDESWKAVTEHFTINKADQIVTFAGVTDGKLEKTYGDSAFEQAATVTLQPNVSGQTPGAVTYTSGNPAVATVDSTGKVTILGAGTATITASAAATQNYKGAEASYKLTVNPKSINSPDVTASQIPDQPYGGVPVTPEFSLIDSDLDITENNLEVNVDYTFEYSNNNGEGEGKITITGKGNYTGKKEVTFKIIPWSESQVVVTPAAITIYMGGANGYEGAVVDEETGSITASSSLPEPGFLFTLPEMLKDALAANHADLTDITFREPDSGKEWTAEFYADGASTVYRLVPSGDQEPVRVQFTNAQGQTVTEDKFEVGENINQTLTMTLYKGDVGVIYAIYDGVQYPIRLGKSTLTVRGVTDEAQYATVTGGTAAPEAGKPAVTAESGTIYTINDSDVPVEDASGVALLFDSIIDANGEDRAGMLEDKAEDTMETLNKEPASGNRFAYSFQYLDLVDTNNGNAWVKASQNVTIYWPYPAGTNKDTEFTLLHFEGLHREMDTSEIGDQIANCTVSEVTSVKKTDTHLVLKVGSAGFSPFALVWEEKIPTYTITATSNGNGSITPAGVTTVQEGGSQSYTIKADNGYHISDVKVNGVSVGAVEIYTFTNVQSNQTIAVTFSRNSSGGGGGGGGHTKPSDPDEDIPDEPGSADPFDTGVGNWLNTEDHTAYLGGYGGGLFGPDDNMTRAQAAQMFYNLLLDQDVPITVSFTDVAADAWYAKAVNTLASLGIVDGVGNSQFAPERAITRAEFTVIAMRFAHLDTTGENIFSDVKPDDWFYAQVVGSIKYGWITGYTDGTFRPGSTITRAEVTTIVNRMLGRSADKAFVDSHADTLTQFDDVSRTDWAYYQIMEATNAHDYKMSGGVEDWTRLQ